MIKIFYPCDPAKNTKCTKEACGLMCTMTSDPTCAKDNWTFKDLKILVKQEAEKHENNRDKEGQR